MAGIEISIVRDRADWRDFLNLPWLIYRGDPLWVPPLRDEVGRLLDQARHPFWRQARGQVFLARREGQAVGRLAALVDERHNQTHDERAGVFGFFECLRDPQAAMALFLAAEDWLRGQGMDFLRGPLNPSLNYEAGLLVQGFDTSPALMMTYNPPYYLDLLHGCGLRKEKDLISFRFPREHQWPSWIEELARAAAERPEFSVVHADPRHLRQDILRMNQIFSECWRDNWGFVPMTDAEVLESARGLKAILDPDLAFFLCHEGREVGVCLCLPDISPLLKRFNGRLGPSALWKRYRHWSEVRGVRGLLLGVQEEYRQMGLPLLALFQMLAKLKNKPHYQYVEVGWDLEDNQSINNLYLDWGKQPDKRYRILRKPLRPGG